MKVLGFFRTDPKEYPYEVDRLVGDIWVPWARCRDADFAIRAGQQRADFRVRTGERVVIEVRGGMVTR